MKVVDYSCGRFGNVAFRYLASSLFCIIYGASRIYESSCSTDIIVTENGFYHWMNEVLRGYIPELDKNATYYFMFFYQHDKIYLKYKSQLIEHIKKNPIDILKTDKNEIYYSYMLLQNNDISKYHIVCHLRLEDFIHNALVIHPQYIKKALDHCVNTTNAIFLKEEKNEVMVNVVVNKATTELENKYIDYFKRYFNVVLHSNDVITDYHLLQNADTLICSCSTLSWVAALLSDCNKVVYFPNYSNATTATATATATATHQTCSQPNKNTHLYDIVKYASQEELEEFLK